MKPNEALEMVRKQIAPVMSELQALVDAEQKKFSDLMERDHDILGRLLKCHLVLERYINNFLAQRFPDLPIDEARLTFSQKVQLLPNRGTCALAKPGIVKLNSIRNKFAHQIAVQLTDADLGPIGVLVNVARENAQQLSPIEKIETFCYIAFASLLVMPTHIEKQMNSAIEFATKAFAEHAILTSG